MPGRAVRGRVASSPDTDTLYPKHIDSGAARVVTLCFGFCSLLCFVLFYAVLALAIIPEMKEGDWQDVRCRAKDATIASEPSRVCRGKGDVNCDVETDPQRPTPGGLWEERCHDTTSVSSGSCVNHVWANVLLEWEQPEDDHRKVNPHVDRMAEGVHETVGRMIHKKSEAARTQKYLSVCYPYHCGGTQGGTLERRKVAEAQALSFVQHLRNESGLPVTEGTVTDSAADGSAGASGYTRPTAGDGSASGSLLGGAQVTAPGAVVAKGDEKVMAPRPASVKHPIGVPPKEQQVPNDGKVQPGGEDKLLIDLKAAAEQQQHSGPSIEEKWLLRTCSYSRTFYATVPGISPLRRGASAAVYFKRPSGYVDLPGGVTVWSVITLLIFGACTVGQLCCLYSQCKAYGYGGIFDRKHSKSRNECFVIAADAVYNDVHCMLEQPFLARCSTCPLTSCQCESDHVICAKAPWHATIHRSSIGRLESD